MVFKIRFDVWTQLLKRKEREKKGISLDVRHWLRAILVLKLNAKTNIINLRNFTAKYFLLCYCEYSVAPNCML